MRAFITFLIVAITLVILAKNSYPQEVNRDSVIYTKDADFSFYKTTIVKYADTKDVEERRDVIEAENINTVVFLKKDSLALISDSYKWFHTNLEDLNEAIIKTGSISPIIGIVPGIVVGGLIGLVVGGALVNPAPQARSFEEGMNKFLEKSGGYILGALFGAIGGGIAGAVIIHAINHKTLDLLSVPDKDKKNKLIKFLRQNKK